MKNSLIVILAGTLWGVISIPLMYLEGLGFTAQQCVAIRGLFTSVLLVVYLLIRDPKQLRIEWRDLPVFFGTGVISVSLFNYLLLLCMERSEGPAVPTLLLYTAPVFVMLISALLFKERVTKKKITALALTMVGLLFVTGTVGSGEKIGASALLLGLGAGLGYALYSIFSKLVAEKYSAVTITTWTFIFSGVVMFPVSGVASQISLLCNLKNFLMALFLSLGCSMAPFLLYTSALRKMEAGRAAVLATVEPLVAALVGAIYFHESFSWTKVLGIVIVLGAILWLNLPEKKHSQTVEKST